MQQITKQRQDQFDDTQIMFVAIKTVAGPSVGEKIDKTFQHVRLQKTGFHLLQVTHVRHGQKGQGFSFTGPPSQTFHDIFGLASRCFTVAVFRGHGEHDDQFRGGKLQFLVFLVLVNQGQQPGLYDVPTGQELEDGLHTVVTTQIPLNISNASGAVFAHFNATNTSAVLESVPRGSTQPRAQSEQHGLVLFRIRQRTRDERGIKFFVAILHHHHDVLIVGIVRTKGNGFGGIGVLGVVAAAG